MTTLKIIQVETEEHKRQVRELFWEYFNSNNLMIVREFNISSDVSTILEQTIEPYPENEIPQKYHSKWVFMEMILSVVSFEPGSR